ncbi:MAG: isoleucine--tRNA ligase [Dehalococcoidia bacterium]|jgi:isoleucyl-tRNA synthetase|nr:isoleucine--tRNA ligase [Dehalococcoidia bacterium]
MATETAPTDGVFDPVPSRIDFVAQEEATLEQWRERDTVARYLRRNDGSDKQHSFIDGPITANNPMAVHHAWGRTYKDLFLRWRNMQGYRQRFQNGFDGQGLWVEVEVEKELGFGSKRDIETYGIGRFVEDCKARVDRFAAVITDQSRRLAQWMDWDDSYHTKSDENNYTIWHFLRRCYEKGWLYEGTDSMPWCPRCGTGLSNMEIATEGYREITHDSVYLKFPLLDRENESLLVWTTTPWTLAANVAAAVHPDKDYSVVERVDELVSKTTRVILATKLLDRALGGTVVRLEHEQSSVMRVGPVPGIAVEVERLKGSELVGLTYSGPFDELPAQDGVAHRVIEWDEVAEDEGTGIVHIAPGGGHDDFLLGKKYDLPVLAPLDEAGVYIDGYGFLVGQVAGEVAQPVFDSLAEKEVLERVEPITHRYPVCWRCDSELVFRVVDEWFISMDELRHTMMDHTRRIQWVPEFGLERELDWLRNMDDWMISKKRYYGLALPIWKCECGHVDVIGSETELEQRAVDGWDEFAGNSPHRPWVDAVRIECPDCGQQVSRIPDVGNPWLDAGIVPFATLGYRHNRGEGSQWAQWFPADWISESFPGQFRNWFYSMLAMSAVLEETESFRACFTYALLRDEQGDEMHKSKGNAIWFEDAADKMGVDVMRWMYASHTPANNLNFGYHIGDNVRRRFLIPLWNVYSFFITYANLDRWDPATAVEPEEKSELDRWLLSELNLLNRRVTDALGRWRPEEASRELQQFVDSLSNWYVRRSRRRFWTAEGETPDAAAYWTLYTCLTTLSRLLAPFTPFVTEVMYQNLVAGKVEGAPDSVHLDDWPAVDETAIDEALSADVEVVRRMVSLGRSARSAAQLRVRQPLGSAVLIPRTDGERDSLQRLAGQIAEELNVKAVEIASEGGDRLRYRVRPNLPVLGPRYGSDIQRIRAAIEAADGADLAAKMRAGGTIELDGFELSGGDLLVDVEANEGWAAAEDGGYAALIDTAITAELASEGLAREIVRQLQNLRRDAGFDISDRIHVRYEGDAAVQAVVAEHARYIADETLALSIKKGGAGGEAATVEATLDGHDVALRVTKVQ